MTYLVTFVIIPLVFMAITMTIVKLSPPAYDSELPLLGSTKDKIQAMPIIRHGFKADNEGNIHKVVIRRDPESGLTIRQTRKV